VVIGVGDTGKSYAGGADLCQFDLGLLASLIHGLYDVIDGGGRPYANMICGFGASFSKYFVARAENNRATIGPASINTQPEFINMIAQHSKLFFNSAQLNYDISE
jgi:hypothetical protein